jgi:hypothetical protein
MMVVHEREREQQSMNPRKRPGQRSR